MAEGLVSLVLRTAKVLEELQIPYALGGSMASSMVGEPRSTVDVDLAVRVDASTSDALLERMSAQFYVPIDSARDAIRSHSSFNMLDTHNALKVDLFIVGSGLLDCMQIERRVLVPWPGAEQGIWVTSPEDQVLRKLDWFRQGGGVSDHQWRDALGILRVRYGSLDLEYLRATASAVGLADDLARAHREAGSANL